MLVLTRKPEEKIIIGNSDDIGNGDEIVITILKVQGGKVSIGIRANKKWQIVRKELLDEEQDCKKQKRQKQEEKEPANEVELVGFTNN